MPFETNTTTLFEFGASTARPTPPPETVTVAGKMLRVTPVFDAYWKFAAERQRIFFRRVAGETDALTHDPVLRNFKFTNAYRASDRVSQYLIREVIYRDDAPQDPKNLFFRILLFKLFNKIETWEALKRSVGTITWDSFNFRRFDVVLSKRMDRGERNYSAAYIMPSGGSVFGYKLKHQNHLRMLEDLVRSDFHKKLTACKNMASAFSLLRSVPFLGPFLAFQYVTDFNYSTLTDFGEDEFVVAGPGALDGIHKCFANSTDASASDIIRYMYDHQEKHFEQLGISFPSLWGRPLQLIDCQNLFCEISKYARAAYPDYAGISGRTRIKQKFHSHGPLPTPWYPPKWNLDAAQQGG